MKRRQYQFDGKSPLGLLAPLPASRVDKPLTPRKPGSSVEKPLTPRKEPASTFTFTSLSSSPCRSKSRQQPKDHRDAYVDLKPDVMSQLQADVKITVLDRWDCDSSPQKTDTSKWEMSPARSYMGATLYASICRGPQRRDVSPANVNDNGFSRPSTERGSPRRRPYIADWNTLQAQTAGWYPSQSSIANPLLAPSAHDYQKLALLSSHAASTLDPISLPETPALQPKSWTATGEPEIGNRLEKDIASQQTLSKEQEEALNAFLISAERAAMEQTINPHYVLVDAEKEVLKNALAIARMDAPQQVMLFGVGSKTQRGSIRLAGHGDALLSFVPRTLRRCIRSGLVNLDQWKVLLESPVNSWYDPVLSRFPAAVVFADASGFTKLTETLAKQPQGAEKIGQTLNSFFGPLIDIVKKHGGDIIKFSGDAVTIIWAAAEPAANNEKHSVGPRRRSHVADDNAASQSGSHKSTHDGALPKERRRRRSATEELCKNVGELHDMAKAASVLSAASFCLEVQREIHKFGQTPVPGCMLTMHIGVGFGDLALMQLGGLLGRWEYCIAGKALDQISIAEPLATSGETVFSPEAREIAEKGMPGRPVFKFEEIDSSLLPDGASVGFAKLIGEDSDIKAGLQQASSPEVLSWWIEKSKLDLDVRLIKRYVPSAVALRLACAPEAESVTYPEEMRRISVVFLSIAGLDPSSCEPKTEFQGLSGSRETQLLMRLMQRSVYALEGSVNKFLVDDKGILLLVCFGLPPLIHFSDDPVRAVLCAMRLRDTLKDEGVEGRIGVATGQCWCGVVGTEVRREYTVLGDTVNLAARLMGKAAKHQIVVDSTTKQIAEQVLGFDDGQVFSLKGKVEPVRAFRFLGPRKGLKRNRKDVQVALMKWPRWPAQLDLVKALEQNAHRSSVMIISGPGGGGKTELAEGVRNWAVAKGWTLLAGQNMDPSNTFALPRHALQEAFEELVRIASTDLFWRQRARDLLRTSLGGRIQASVPQEHRPPTHAELYWMLVSMLRCSMGEEAAADLETWMPLLSLVITQLAFEPHMVAAMVERDEQHARNSKLTELCAGIVDAFTRFGSSKQGTVVLLHIHRSSAFYQSKDKHEMSVIQALAESCSQRRRSAPSGEDRPFLLCVAAWDSARKDGTMFAHAEECNCVVESEDVDLQETRLYVDHLLRLRAQGDQSHKWGLLTEDVRRASREEAGDVLRRLSEKYAADMRASSAEDIVPGFPEKIDTKTSTLSNEESVAYESVGTVAASAEEDDDDLEEETVIEDQQSEILAAYVYEMTGGNLLAIKTVFDDLLGRKIIFADEKKPYTYKLDPQCIDSEWIKKTVPVPESLVGMAFSNFERLDPKEQMVLKAATTFDGAFGVQDLCAALPKLEVDDICQICTRLASKEARAFRLATAREAVKHRCSTWSLFTYSHDKHKDESSLENERFQFYSGVLRYAASSLVLEAQRSEVRRNSKMMLSRMSLSKSRPSMLKSMSDASLHSVQSQSPRSARHGLEPHREFSIHEEESEDEAGTS